MWRLWLKQQPKKDCNGKETMKTTTHTPLVLLLLVGTGIAGSYDFFDLSRYPEGGKLKEGVELYKVREPGGAPQEYARRVVRWWPRKGVDVVDVKDGMIEREWTLAADMLDAVNSPDPKFEWQTFEHDKLDMPLDVGENYIRQIQGYLIPPKDDDYTFKIAADNMGIFFLSTDESPLNIKPACYSYLYTHRNNFERFPGQISKPIPLKKGHKYYYELLHKEDNAVDNAMVVWETPTMEQEVIGAAALMTLDGKPGKVIEKRASLDSGLLGATGIRARDQVRRFKAHLIGFDGIGNDLGDPTKEAELRESGVILRLSDGRRQTFAGGSFCREDREYIYRLYQKEMARIKGTLDKTVYTIAGVKGSVPVDTPAGQPGSWRKHSEHLVIPSGSQGNSEWINVEDPAAGERYRALIFSSYENMYAFYEYGGHLMPYWDRKEKFKYSGIVGGTIVNGYEVTKGGAGGGYGAQGLAPGIMPGGGFAHEYGHGFTLQWNGQFSGETICQHMMCLMQGGRATGFSNSILRPWRNNLHASYDTTLFFSALGYDPNWGLLAVAALPKAEAEVSIYQTMARVGQQRGLYQDGIRGVGDTVGDYAARMAELDWPNREYARGEWFSALRNYLEPINPEKGVYRIPWDEAPEPFGVNIVRLLPQEGVAPIEVDFLGYHDPAIYSDWRACIVAVDKDGKCRYSDLWNKGVMQMPRLAGDQRYWLTVAATPSALMASSATAAYYSGHFAPRHPWQVTLRGAVPGTPQRTRLDLNDVCGIYGNPWLGGFVPVVPDTAAGRKLVQEASAFVGNMEQALPKANLVERLFFGNNIRHAQQAITNPGGAPHPNGGGWVAATAQAAATAYIGPNARVLDKAKVLDQAIIEDYAVIRQAAEISGHARVSGQAVIADETKLGGYQRAWASLSLGAEKPAPDLTARLYPVGLDENGLWANYAMDQAEAFTLNDYFRSGERRDEMPPIYNGYLYGNPAFLIDDSHRGFSFDGKSQYAELNRRIADLGEITVDMTVKWQGADGQTLLDCGSGPDNRFTLTTGGKGGGIAFAAIVGGRNVAGLTSSAALVKDMWTRVRLEIDGTRVALWINDKPAGEMASDFRPAHVFQPGKTQRNFIAATLDGKAQFKGIFDSVMVYHKVHGEAFAKLPVPGRDAPCRPVKGFARDVRVSTGMSAFEQADRKERIVKKGMEAWGYRASCAKARIAELHHRVPEYLVAHKEAAAFDKWQRETPVAFRKAFDESAEGVKSKTRIADITDQVRALDVKIKALPKPEPATDKTPPPTEPTPEMMALRKKIEPLQAQIAEMEKIEKDALAAVAAMPESKAAREEIARLEKELAPMTETCRKKLADAEANDETVKWVKTSPHTYIRADARVMRGFQGGGSLTCLVRDRLMARDPEFRKWVEAGERVEELKRKESYRVHDHLLRHTDHPALLAQSQHDKGELERARGELNGIQQQLQNQQRVAEPTAGRSQEAIALLAEKGKLEVEAGRLTTELNGAREKYVEATMKEAGVNEKTAANEELLKKAAKVVSNKYHAELHTLYSFLRQNFHGFYNGTIDMYLGEYAQRATGGAMLRDNLDEVAKMEDAYAPENWKTRIDQWDWRTQWEVDGTIKDLPLTQKWLRRVRGE
jgi:hypothetical protein